MLSKGSLLQGRYKTLRPLGRGGMGAVYLALDTRFETEVAVKEYLLGDDVDCRAAFAQEARLLNKLRHASLSHVIDYFSEGDGDFLVMQFIEGESLEDSIARRMQSKEGPYPWSQVLQWADELLDALDYLHKQTPSVIHLDIKPQNLILTPKWKVILLDFGLARIKAPENEAYLSLAGYTPSYASLEQLTDGAVDPRSDLYSLGVTIYKLMTGMIPPDAMKRMARVMGNQLDPLELASVINPQIPRRVAEALQSALALEKDFRPKSAAQMRAELQDANRTVIPKLQEQKTELAPLSPPEQPADNSLPLTTRMAGVSANESGSDMEYIYQKMITGARAAALVAESWAAKADSTTSPQELGEYLGLSRKAAEAVHSLLCAAEKAKAALTSVRNQ